MPWWGIAYLIVLGLFVAAALADDLKEGAVGRFALSLLAALAAFAGALCYWLVPHPSRGLAIGIGIVLAVGLVLLIRDSAADIRRLRETDPNFKGGGAIFTAMVVAAFFLPAFATGAMFVARGLR